jgi:hypothetical protein
MALPTPSVAYTASANNYITSNGPLPSQWQNRSYDIANMLCTLTTRLIQSGFAIHYASSVPNARSTVNNLWDIDDPAMAAGISQFGNTLINAAITYGSNIWQPSPGYTYISWIVLDLTQGGQLCIGFYFPSPLDINRSGFKISYSPSSDFGSSIPGLTDLQIPTAIDEIKLYDNGFAPIDASSPYGITNYWRAIFDNDYQGILNTAQNRGNYNLQVQVVTANDNSAFWMAAFRDNDCAQFMYFSFGLENPVTNVPWNTCPIFYIDRGPIFSRIVENNSTSLLKAAFTTPSPSSTGWTFGGAALYSRNQYCRYNPSIDDDVGEYVILPVPFFAFSPVSLGYPTGQYTGLKGLIKDMWVGQTQTSPAVYPATGPAELVQINDFILPWDTAAAAPLFIG